MRYTQESKRRAKDANYGILRLMTTCDRPAPLPVDLLAFGWVGAGYGVLVDARIEGVEEF